MVSRTGGTVAVVLGVWFTLILLLGAGGTLVTPPGALPLGMGIAVTAPIVLFLAALWLSRPFREFVLAADVRLMLGIQAWRFAGLGFLALYWHGILLGLLDLVVAVGSGVLASALATGVAGEVTAGPMAKLPLVLIPAYFVPIFVMLHIAALIHGRRLARNLDPYTRKAPGPV